MHRKRTRRAGGRCRRLHHPQLETKTRYRNDPLSVKSDFPAWNTTGCGEATAPCIAKRTFCRSPNRVRGWRVHVWLNGSQEAGVPSGVLRMSHVAADATCLGPALRKVLPHPHCHSCLALQTVPPSDFEPCAVVNRPLQLASVAVTTNGSGTGTGSTARRFDCRLSSGRLIEVRLHGDAPPPPALRGAQWP